MVGKVTVRREVGFVLCAAIHNESDLDKFLFFRAFNFGFFKGFKFDM